MSKDLRGADYFGQSMHVNLCYLTA